MVVAESSRKRKNSYDGAMSECNSILPGEEEECDDEEARRISANLTRDLEKITANINSEVSTPQSENAYYKNRKDTSSVEVQKTTETELTYRNRLTKTEITGKAVPRRSRSREKKKGENKENCVSENKEEVPSTIKLTRVEDILKPEPPVRSDSKESVRALVRGLKSPEMMRKGLMSPESTRRKQSRTPFDVVTPTSAPPPATNNTPPPSPVTPLSPTLERSDRTPGQSLLEQLRKRKERIMNNKAEPVTPRALRVNDSKPTKATANDSPPLQSPDTQQPIRASPTQFSPKAADDLEKQTLDSLEGLTATIIKERDQARKERNDAREKCENILEEYGGRRQVWQNSLNVVKLRLDHYERRHDKLRNDIVKQRNSFDIERTRMKDRHATQIEGLFGELFNKIKSDNSAIGSPSEVAEVNYKLDAFMKLWKGLATDVDDIYDKEHYCLRLCESVKTLEEQIKKQNKVISMLLKGHVPVIHDTPSTDLPSPNINIVIDDQKWEIKIPETLPTETLPTEILPSEHDVPYTLPKFDELKLLDSLLPKSATSSTDDILAQFSEIENQFDNLSNSLSRNSKLPKPTMSPLASRKPYTPKPRIQVKETTFAPRPVTPVTPVTPVDEPIVEMDAVVDVKAAVKNYEQPEKPKVPKTAFTYTPHPPKQPEPEPEPTSVLDEMLADLATEVLQNTKTETTFDGKGQAPYSPQLLHIEPEPSIAKPSKLETTFDEPASTPQPPIRDTSPRKKKMKKKRPQPVIVPDLEPQPTTVPEPQPKHEVVEPAIRNEPHKPLHAAKPSTPKIETTLDEPAQREPKPTQREPKLAHVEPKPAQREPKPTQREPKPAQREPKPAKSLSPSEASESLTAESLNSIPMLNCSPKSSRAPSHYRLDLNEDPVKPDTPVEDPVTPEPEQEPLKLEPCLEQEPLKVEPPKSRKWTPSFPIFRKAKSEKGVPTKKTPKKEDPEPARSERAASIPKTNPTKSTPSIPSTTTAPAHNPYTPQPIKPPARPLKRAKSMPKLRKDDLEDQAPRNVPMRRYLSNPRLRHKSSHKPGDPYSDSEDSELEGLIANVYTPLHLTPHSRSLSRRTLGDDDAKSTTSSFARRAPIPASMGWLDNNNGDSTCQSSTESSEEDSEEGSESDNSSSGSGSGSGSESDDEIKEDDNPLGNERSDSEDKTDEDEFADPPPQQENPMDDLISSLLEDDWIDKVYSTPVDDNREIAF